MDNTGIFGNAYDDEDVEEEVDMNNVDSSYTVPDTSFTKFHKDHPEDQVIQALEDPSWVEAMQDELLQFKLLNVWTLVDLPRDKWAIGTKWVFRNKKDERGIVVKNKARLVAQGHTQEEGIDYDEVFALVARIEAIRLFLAYASFKDYVVYQMDVNSAFLYGKIEEEVYVCQPPGFEDPHFPNKVYKVEKALYGLHQAPRAWYETLSTYLLENGFHRGQVDKTLFIKIHKDDILLVQVQQKSDGIFISQDKYVAEILKKFDFASVKTASTPMETNKALIKDEEAEDVDVHLYRSMIGSLMYLTASRPDIMFAVCACARFQVTPKTSHLNVVKRIFRYLKGQPKLGLWYPRDSPFDLEAFSDSDYAGASLDRKSTTGGCQFLGKRLISWQCKKQTIVANSTTEAEYVAAANCCGQVLWIQNQMLDYGFNFMNTKIYIDNESTICIVKNPVFHSKTKHIEIRHHFIRDSYEKKLIQVIKIHTDQNVADLLTKAFDASRVKTAKSQIDEKTCCDEAVHKELGDRMERAATTTSSLEAEQDSDAQTRLETTSKQFNNSPLSKVNTFGSRKDSMQLMELMTHYTKLSALFWATAKVKTVNDVRQIQALIDKKKLIITETSIRSDLHLEDAGVFINQQLGDMSHHKKIYVNPSHTKKIFANMKREGKDFSGRITPLFDTMMVQASEEVGEDSDHLTDFNQIPIVDQPSTSSPPKKKQKSKRKQIKEAEVAHDETEHEESVLDLEKVKSDQAIEIASLKKREDASKQGRRIEDINADAEVTLVNETQERQDEDLMFDTGVSDDTTTGVEDSVAHTIQVSTTDIGDEGVTAAKIDELTLAQTLIEIKAAKPKVEPSEFRTSPEAQPSKSKDKGKAIMVEPEVPLKRKDQVALDEDLTRSIQAQLDAEIKEEERLERQKQEEANIALIESWENTQAMMEADRLLAERLQTREREELTDEKKGKLFMELMEKRRKHFAAIRAQEKRNIPPTKAQKKSQMSTDLKHMGEYKHKQLMRKSYDEIQKLFDKEMKRVNTFVAMSSETQESNEKKVEGSEEKAKSSRKKSLGKKRAVKEQQQESPKRKKLRDDKQTDEHEEVEADDTAELKKHLVIKKDDDIAIDVIPLATKPPVIVDYKLLKEGIMVHYQLIRADGSSKRHSSMIRLLQGIDKEDLQTLWKLVKTKHGDLRPEDEHERVLWGDLKVMFEPDIRSDVWRNLQGYKVTIWKLIDSCGVHFVRNLKIQKMNIKFRGGLLGLKRLQGFLLLLSEVKTVRVETEKYAK
ncbi:putative ribonuclease H-like domain-containing protein [Tanacetum coccineum]